jgi:predicted dinucleotide-binding enzyme
MKIGIVGSGNVGGTLGTRFAKLGHSVFFGTRKPVSPEMQKLARLPGAQVVSQQQAAQAADVVVLATPWPAAEGALRGLGDLKGKILLDCTNPVKANLEGLEFGTTTSAGEQVSQWAGGARVIKIFNTVGSGIMANPRFGNESVSMFYCGDDSAAKSVARDLAVQLGFDPIDIGPLRQARLLEPFALLWISLALGGYGTEIAFRLMRR